VRDRDRGVLRERELRTRVPIGLAEAGVFGGTRFGASVCARAESQAAAWRLDKDSRRCAIRSIAAIAASICSPVVPFPNEKRMADAARSADNPIASKTCDATTEPTMQAEPLEAQTPSRSSAISIVSESKPGKLAFSVLASRGAPAACYAMARTRPSP